MTKNKIIAILVLIFIEAIIITIVALNGCFKFGIFAFGNNQSLSVDGTSKRVNDYISSRCSVYLPDIYWNDFTVKTDSDYILSIRLNGAGTAQLREYASSFSNNGFGDVQVSTDENFFANNDNVRVNVYHHKKVSPFDRDGEYVDIQIDTVSADKIEENGPEQTTSETTTVETTTVETTTAEIIETTEMVTESIEIVPDITESSLSTEMVSVYFDINFHENLFLSKYDVEIYIDDKLIDIMPHGKYYTHLTNVAVGSHLLKFRSANDSEIVNIQSIDIVSDCSIVCSISTQSIMITVDDFEIRSDISGASLVMPDVVGMTLDKAKDILEGAGFINIKAEASSGYISLDKNWVVDYQSVTADTTVDKNTEIVLICHKDEDAYWSTFSMEPKPEESSSADSDKGDRLSYSTNDLKTAEKGNTGVFAYKSKGGTYDNYYIIDFDEGYVYNFSEGNGNSICDRVKIVSGDLNDKVIITYHDGGYTWSYGLHFKWKNHPDHLVLQEESGFEYDFYNTDLDKALKIRDTKTITDY